jgi:DNA repair exonuclease SbcCD nuclease subunit
MKIGFLSDLHIKLHKKNSNFLPHIVKSVDYFYDLCIEKDVDFVFVLGDVFHIKDTVAIEAQHAALKSLNRIFKRWPSYMIPGNHDILSKKDASINGLSIFGDSCTLIEDLSTQHLGGVYFHFLPYLPDELVISKLKSLKIVENSKNILCTHLGLRSFVLENGHEDVYSDLEVKDIDVGFDRIFSGHYHSHQTKGKVTYVSSPYESHYGDEGDHGFVFYDTDSDSIEFVENQLSPKFKRIDLSAKNMDLINSFENCFIKLIVKKNIDNSLLIKYRDKLLKKNFDVLYEFDLQSSSSKISVAKDWEHFVSETPEEILRSYIKDNNFEGMNKEALLSYLGI